MKIISNKHILADEGMTLVRLSNGEVMGKELRLGKTYYVGGKRLPFPLDEVPSNFTEISDEQAKLQQYTYNATNVYDAVVALIEAGQWNLEDDDKDTKAALIDKYGGISDISYDTLVTRLVRVKYSADQMEALINNYLDAPNESTHLAEWLEMQRWRQRAKEIANDIINVLT